MLDHPAITSVYWTQKVKDIEEFCAACEHCILVTKKASGHRVEHPSKPTRPLERVQLDAVTLRESKNGYTGFYTIIDCYSKKLYAARPLVPVAIISC
jgi:hypothetical protein